MAIGKVPGIDPDADGDEGVFAESNITPLTDIFLVLLIIFMVTSTVIVRQADSRSGRRAGLKVNHARAGAAADVRAGRTDIPVAILQDGRLVLRGTVVTIDEPKAAFEKARTENAEALVIVQADEGVHHGRGVEVMELAKRAGLGQLAIGVREESR